VGCDVPVDNDAFLVIDFMNLKIKPAQSSGGAHRGRMCVRVFIGVSAHTCMSIYVCTVFLKKHGHAFGSFSYFSFNTNIKLSRTEVNFTVGKH
jgi:hypothetical protein